MKRWRLLKNLFFDTRRNLLSSLGPAELTRDPIIAELKNSFGEENFDGKLSRFREIAPPWASVDWGHLDYEQEVFDAYVFGSFYSALTGICCLTEALLNTLIGKLQTHYKASSYYKQVQGKDWIQNWDLLIEALEDWNVVTTEQVKTLDSLKNLRNDAVHFSRLHDVEDAARRAMNLYTALIGELFGPHSENVFWCPGEIYIRKEREKDPFVQEFILPSATYVGYKHYINEEWRFVDGDDYEDREVSNEEFRELRIGANS